MIKKIIHTFLHNPMPEQVQQQFRTWCLNKERAGEKTDALWKEWERLDPASVLPADEKAYRRKLDRLHRFTASGSRAVRLEGEAFFDVKRDTLRPFEVEMGKLRVKVLGTRFTASHMPAFNTEEVTLLSGKVEVSGYRADQSVVLTPDQSCSYDAGSGAVAVRNVAASNYCSWTGNSIIFDNMTLADIAVNLEHWYNIRFRIDERIDTSIRISFTLRPETLEETLKIIETLTHLRCRQIDKHYVIIHK